MCKLLEDYGLDMREEGRAEGRTEGLIEGIEEGRIAKSRELAEKLFRAGSSDLTIAELLELPEALIHEWRNTK